MFSALLFQRASAVIAAVLGGYGVFCAAYSFVSPRLAAQAFVLLGAALVISYFNTGEG